MADLFKKKEAPADGAVENAPAEEKKEKKQKASKKQYLEHNKMNFLERYETIVEGKQNDVDFDALKKPIIIILGVLLVLLIITQALSIFTSARVKSLEKYINDPNNVASYAQATELKTKIDQTEIQKVNMESLIAAIATYPDVDQAFFQAISKAANDNSVSINGYGFTSVTGNLTLNCNAPTPQDVSDFVRSLMATGRFVSIDYTGFTGAQESGYSFSISAVCVAGK